MRRKGTAIRVHRTLAPALPAVLALAVLALAGCTADRPAGDEPVVARVGEAGITARELETSYAFGFRHLKRGDDPRAAYLQHMIAEKLMALEGYRLGLDGDPDVRRQVESLRQELLVEQVFEREVNDRIVVTDEEIRAAMQEDHVRFRLRYLPAPTLDDARRLADEARTAGFDAALDRLLREDAERAWRREDFERPYLTRHDLDPTLLDAVADLPAGEVSAPVPYRGSFVVLQVADVQREPVPPGAAERERYEQIVFLRKAKAEARRFVGEMMQPLDVRVKPRPFRTLRDALRALYLDRQRQGLAVPANLFELAEASEGVHAETLRALAPDTLMTTRDGAWTVEAFLRAYPVDRYPLSTTGAEAFESDLYDALGLTLRDRAFVAKAEAEGLGDAPEVRAELARWTDRWVYRALRSRLADTVQVSTTEARAYFERHADYYRSEHADAAFEDVEEAVRRDARAARRDAGMADYLAHLRERYPVAVEHPVLDTLAVDDAAGPDVLFFKGHTGRLAFPVVDPWW